MQEFQWLFIDFDSYFASVEQHLNPDLRGKPVGVVPMMAETTSCIAASYEAKAYGIKTGTRVAEARRMCPGIQFVEAVHQAYVQYHHLFHEAIEELTPITQTLSIDEVSCKLPASYAEQWHVENLIESIRLNIAQKVSPWITCSMGVGPNKFLAKLASKYQKPNGAYIIRTAARLTFIHDHKLSDLNGVGRNMEARLRKYGIYSVEQLTQCTEDTLQMVWGSVHGRRMWHALQGHDLEDIKTHSSSLGHSNVLAPHLRIPAHAHKVLHRLLQKAVLRLRAKEVVTSRFQLSLRYENGLRWAQEARFDETNQSHILRHVLNELWLLRPHPQEPLKKVGVNLVALRESDNYTLSLFTQPDQKREAVDAAVDEIVGKFGKEAAYFGSACGVQKAVQMRIAFNHIPDVMLEE